MAEIIRTETTTERRATTTGNPTRTTTVATIVRSIVSNRLDASVIHDFAAALRDAGCPGRTLVYTTVSDAGHLTALHVKWSTEIPEAEPAESSDEPEADRG